MGWTFYEVTTTGIYASVSSIYVFLSHSTAYSPTASHASFANSNTNLVKSCPTGTHVTDDMYHRVSKVKNLTENCCSAGLQSILKILLYLILWYYLIYKSQIGQDQNTIIYNSLRKVDPLLFSHYNIPQTLGIWWCPTNWNAYGICGAIPQVNLKYYTTNTPL